MNEERLNRLKHYYRDETLDAVRVEASWQELSARLPARQYHPYHYVMRYAAVVVVLALFFSSGMIAIAAASPNTLLYPVKLASDHAVAQFTGRYDTLIEHRTDEIINAAQKKSDAEIRKAAHEYQKALEVAKENTEVKPAADEHLRKTLKDSETKLRSVTPANERAQSLIHQSIKATEKTQQEVKGAQTEAAPTSHPDNEQNPSDEHKPDNSGDTTEHSNQGNSNGRSNEHRNGDGNGKK